MQGQAEIISVKKQSDGAILNFPRNESFIFQFRASCPSIGSGSLGVSMGTKIPKETIMCTAPL